MSTSIAPTSTPLVGSLRTFNLQEKVILLSLMLNKPGNERTVKNKSIVTTAADKDRVRVMKTLLDCAEQQKIGILDGQISNYIRRIALPSPFRSGTYSVPIDLLDEIDATLVAFAAEREQLVEAFVAVYEEAKLSAKASLSDLYDEREYLTPDELRASFKMTWQYVTLSTPDKLKEANEAIFLREQQRLKEQWDATIATMEDAMRVGLAELVDDMVERLSGDEKKFKPTKLLERFDEFLKTFDARNVTDNADLKALADKARSVLNGVDTDALKKSKDVREQVKEAFLDAQKTLGQLETAAKGQRRIVFSDE
jgi:hypothetical protein